MTPDLYRASLIHTQCEREHWMLRLKLAGIIACLLFAFAVVGAVDLAVAEKESGGDAAKPETRPSLMRDLEAAGALLRGYRACPAHGEGMTRQLILVVSESEDGQPTVAHCARAGERQYWAPRVKRVAAGSRK